MEPLDDMDQGGLGGGMEPVLGRQPPRPLHQMHQQQPGHFEVAGWKVCANVSAYHCG